MASRYSNTIVLFSVFLLPVLCNLVEHSASTILTVLTVIGIYEWAVGKNIPVLTRNEKIIMASFAFYFFGSLFFFIANGLFREGAGFKWDLDHEIRFLAFIPIYLLFRQKGMARRGIWYGTAIAAILCAFFAVHHVLRVYASADTIKIPLMEALRVSGAYSAIPFGQLNLAFGCMSFCGIRYFHKKHPALVILPVAALLSGILVSFLSGSRGAILAIPFLAAIFFIQMGSFRFPWRKRLALILSLSIVSAGLYFMPGSSMNQRFQTGLTQAKAFFNGEGTGLYVVRLAMWSEAWKIFKAHPVCGVGKNGYNDIIEAKAAKNEIPRIIEKFSTPHNNYLTQMVDYGVFGLFMLLALFLSPFLIFIPAARARWLNNDMAYTGIILIVSFMLFAVTETVFYRNINISVYLIMTAAVLQATRENPAGQVASI